MQLIPILVVLSKGYPGYNLHSPIFSTTGSDISPCMHNRTQASYSQFMVLTQSGYTCFYDLAMDKFRFTEFLLKLQVEGVADMLEKHVRVC